MKNRSSTIPRDRSQDNNMLLPVYRTDSTTESLSSRQIKQRKSIRKALPIISKDDSSTVHSSPQESGKLRRLEADEEQVYLITRNIHLVLHTLLIDAK